MSPFSHLERELKQSVKSCREAPGTAILPCFKRAWSLWLVLLRADILQAGSSLTYMAPEQDVKLLLLERERGACSSR